MIKIIIIILFVILSLGYFLLSIIFSFKYYKSNFEKNPFFKEIENSINGKPIISFNFKSSCSSEEEILYFGEWDGAKEGCKCQNSINPYPCSLINITIGCTNIQSIYPIKYSKINSKYICIKRYNTTYRDLLKLNQTISKNEKCPSNYKSCGIIDTLERQLCFKIDEKCPITSLFFKNEYFSNNIDNSQILSLFKINQYIPCMHPAEKNWTYFYPLQLSRQCNTKILDKLHDYRYEKLPKIETTKYKLYKDNGINDIYNYKYLEEDEIVTLYARSYMGFKVKKIDNFSFEKLLSYQRISNTCGFTLLILSYISFCVVISPAIILYKILNENKQGLTKEGEKGLCLIICVIYIIAIVITIICVFSTDIIINIIIFVCSFRILSILNSLESDKYTNEIIRILIKPISKNYIFSLALNIIFIFMLIFGITFLVIKFCFNNK